VDLSGAVRGDLLDVHPALAGGHQGHPLRGAVDDHADVQLLADVGALLDQQAPHLLPVRPGLMGDELHAENARRMRAHLVERARELHATALAAAAGVDLRLDDPDRTAELLRGVDRLVHGEARKSARYRDAVAAKNVLALVFVDLHAGLASADSWRSSPARCQRG
jgi:hypothetical protein